MRKTIVIICSLDTKGKPARFLKERIEAKGHRTILLDVNMGGQATIPVDISARAVAKAGGGDIDKIRASERTSDVTQIMIKGAILKVQELLDAGRLGGIIAFGGVSNTTAATSIMKALPFGVPKFMVSSSASMPAYAARFIGTKDITMMHSVVDIAELNDLSRNVLERAAGGICGMVEASSGPVRLASASPIVALTEFGFSEACSRYAQQYLEEKGYAVIPIHAQGIGDRAMEELIDQGVFDAVLDIVPAGVSEHLLGGNRSAGARRLEAAGRRGIPQVVTPCGFEMISCGPLERKDRDDLLWTSRQLAERAIYIPDEHRVEARTSAEELLEIAQVVAGKLNQAQGPVAFLIPTGAWSSVSVKGVSLHDPEADAVFAPALRGYLEPSVQVMEVDTHLNTPEFARAAVNALDAMMG
jgi:uncharacterized protein (UPF0261 family)